MATAANGTDTLTWSYDLAGQLLSEQSAKNSSTIAYTYDNAGNRLSVSLDGMLFVSYGYDDASRLATITRGSNVFGFGYDNVNRRTSMSYPNGVSTAYSYDNLNRLLNLSATKAPSTAITNFTYTYDAAGNRTSKALPDYAESYGYDPLQRLTQVQRTGSLTGINTYGYDAVGNRLTNQQGSMVTTSNYDEKNQLLSSTGGGLMLWRGALDEPGSVTFTSALVNGKPARMLAGNVFEANLPMEPGSNLVTLSARDSSGNVTTKSYSVDVTGDGVTYTYDLNGNLAQKIDGADTWTYRWNAENQLTRIQKNGVDMASFKYDPWGRRVEKVDDVIAAYTYEGGDILKRTTGAAVTVFVHGEGIDQPLALEQIGNLSYFHADALGSVVAVTTSGGSVAQNLRYSAGGTLEQGVPDPYGFTGREWDAATGLYYYRARYYDQRTAAFLSEDPVDFGDGLSRYSYVLGNPATMKDPSGQVRVKDSTGSVADIPGCGQCPHKVFTEFSNACDAESNNSDANISRCMKAKCRPKALKITCNNSTNDPECRRGQPGWTPDQLRPIGPQGSDWIVICPANVTPDVVPCWRRLIMHEMVIHACRPYGPGMSQAEHAKASDDFKSKVKCP